MAPICQMLIKWFDPKQVWCIVHSEVVFTASKLFSPAKLNTPSQCNLLLAHLFFHVPGTRLG